MNGPATLIFIFFITASGELLVKADEKNIDIKKYDDFLKSLKEFLQVYIQNSGIKSNSEKINGYVGEFSYKYTHLKS